MSTAGIAAVSWLQWSALTAGVIAVLANYLHERKHKK